MLMTVDELKRYFETDEAAQVLEAKLQALELTIKGYTNNDFERVLAANNGQYPMDIKMGVVNLLKWEANNRDKVGVQSESLSRHSVTYVDQTAANTIAGYPAALMGFLKPYMKARFGQGLMV
jgi:hypothetical protein